MIRLSPASLLPLCGLVLVTSIGCGGVSDRPPVYPVSGKVTLGGVPVEGAQVSFYAEGSPRAASGKTDAEGMYQLTTFDTNDGAVEGSHKVSIAKMQAAQDMSNIDVNNPEGPGDAYGDAMDAAASGQYDKSLTAVLPRELASPETSGLTRTVTASESENVFNFDL